MTRWIVLTVVGTLGACHHPAPPPPPPPPALITFGVVAREAQTARPIGGAQICVDSVGCQIANVDGYTVWVVAASLVDTAIIVTARGYQDRRWDAFHPKDWQLQNVLVDLTPLLPAQKTRAQITGVQITFQGLEVDTATYGRLPWFEAALFSLPPADRQRVYAAKHAAGDTHAIVIYDHGGSIYDEPDQPYQAMQSPAFADHCFAFQDALREVLREGFTPMVFMGGDAGEAGYAIAAADAPGLIRCLQTAPERDLTGDVLIIPGWDGVFYGWTPEHIVAFGQQMRTLGVQYLGIEFGAGHIPLGNGDQDYQPGGGMTTYDVLLAEFDGPPADDTVWQVLARLLGPGYRRGPDQPPWDDPGAPFGPSAGQWYLRTPTPRGPIVPVCFEWVGEYWFVRGRQSVADQQAYRQYLKDRGCQWTG